MIPEHEKSGEEAARPKSASATDAPRGTEHQEGPLDRTSSDPAKDEEFENLKYPQPWKFEKWFLGGYSQKRMLKFKNPKTMYYAINLFAGMNTDTARRIQEHLLTIGVLGIAIMFYGYDQGVMSQVNLNPDYQKHMGIAPVTGRSCPKLLSGHGSKNMLGNSRNVAAEGGIVAVYYGGTTIGALVAGSLADRCGRIKAVVFGSMWALLGAVLQASAYNITWMCCARVIAGVGVGAIDCVIPVWSAEVSSHQARGAFLALEFFMVRIYSC